ENSRRYRMDLPALARAGARTHVGSDLPAEARRGVHTVICVRPFVDARTRRTIDALRGDGVCVVADYDDLLFDCPIDHFPAAERGRFRGNIARRLATYRDGLDAFDRFTCSTAPIAAALARHRPDAPIDVVPNEIDPAWVERGW